MAFKSSADAETKLNPAVIDTRVRKHLQDFQQKGDFH